MQRYYGNESVSGLIKEYQVQVKTSGLYKMFPPIKTDIECRHCQTYLLEICGSKTDRSTSYSSPLYKCINCNHIETNSRLKTCDCDSCDLERKETALKIKEEEKKRIIEESIKQAEELKLKMKIIEKHFGESNIHKICESNLTLEQRLYLAVILRSSLNESTRHLSSFSKVRGNLAPTEEMEENILGHITESNLIIPDLTQNVEYITIYEGANDQYRIGYDIYNVIFMLNIEPKDGNYDHMISRLMFPDLSDEEDFQNFCYEMWKVTALNEVLQYFNYQMDSVGYSFNPGAKTFRVFEYLLEHFSVAQIWGIIYKSVANSTKRYQTGGITKLHAQNSVITSCEIMGERAVANKWNLYGYRRIRELPESYMSIVLYTSIMKIGELGYLEKPTKGI